MDALAGNQGIIGLLDPVPVVVPVHRIIAAGQGSDPADADFLHLADEFSKIVLAGSGRRIAAVEEGMDVGALEILLFAELEQGIEVGIV